MPKFVEWWDVENTGYSGGISWFKSGSADFNTEETAREYALKQKQYLNDPNTKWRYVHTTLEREGNKSVTTKVWTEV